MSELIERVRKEAHTYRLLSDRHPTALLLFEAAAELERLAATVKPQVDQDQDTAGLVDVAVAGEREACAKVAEDPRYSAAAKAVCAQIVTAIRERSKNQSVALPKIGPTAMVENLGTAEELTLKETIEKLYQEIRTACESPGGMWLDAQLRLAQVLPDKK